MGVVNACRSFLEDVWMCYNDARFLVLMILGVGGAGCEWVQAGVLGQCCDISEA